MCVDFNGILPKQAFYSHEKIKYQNWKGLRIDLSSLLNFIFLLF